MDEIKAVDLGQVMSSIRGSGRPNTVLWQAPDSIAFVARGREFRSEFHSDPSDEVMYMIKGDMNLHYRTPEGDEKIALIREGQIVYCPAGTPHSPRFSPDAFVLVLERKRRPDESDRFTWFCEQCGAQLHQSVKQVADYRAGKQKAFNSLVGQVMKASGGKANPAQVNEILRRKLGR